MPKPSQKRKRHRVVTTAVAVEPKDRACPKEQATMRMSVKPYTDLRPN